MQRSLTAARQRRAENIPQMVAMIGVCNMGVGRDVVEDLHRLLAPSLPTFPAIPLPIAYTLFPIPYSLRVSASNHPPTPALWPRKPFPGN